MLLVPHPTPPSYAHLWHVYGYLNGSHVLKLLEHCIWHHHKVTNGDLHIKFTITSRVWGLLFGCIEEAWGSERHWVAGLGSDLSSLIYMLTICMHYVLGIDWDPRMSAPIYKVCNLRALYTLTWSWFPHLLYWDNTVHPTKTSWCTSWCRTERQGKVQGREEREGALSARNLFGAFVSVSILGC